MSVQKLSLLVHPALLGTETQALAQKGHRVEPMDGQMTLALIDYDLILGPNCWRIMPKLLKYLELAVKEARKQKKAP